MTKAFTKSQKRKHHFDRDLTPVPAAPSLPRSSPRSSVFSTQAHKYLPNPHISLERGSSTLTGV